MSYDTASLSYVSELSDELWLFMLDTCKYENNSETNPSTSFGDIREETYGWLEEKLKEAEKKGVTPIVVMHHNLLEHSRLFSFGYVLNNSQEIVELFNLYHVRVVLSGHMHIQDIKHIKRRRVM